MPRRPVQPAPAGTFAGSTQSTRIGYASEVRVPGGAGSGRIGDLPVALPGRTAGAAVRRATSGSTISLPRIFASQSAGMPDRPNRIPARPPAIAAVVSVSPPYRMARSIASR